MFVFDEGFTHGWIALQAFVTAAAGCTLLMTVVAPAVLSRIVPERWKKLPEEKRVAAAMDLAQIVPAVATTLLVWEETLDLNRRALANPADTPYLRAGAGVAAGAGVCLGYMAAHCVVLIKNHEICKRALCAFYWVTWLHHGLSLVIWPLGLFTSSYIYWVAWFLFSEVSNVLMDPRELMISLGMESSPVFLPLSISWVVVFTVSRMIPMLPMLWLYATADWSRMPIAHMAVGHLTVPLPLLLNSYWFSLIMKGLFALITGDSQAATRNSCGVTPDQQQQQQQVAAAGELRRRQPSQAGR